VAYDRRGRLYLDARMACERVSEDFPMSRILLVGLVAAAGLAAACASAPQKTAAQASADHQLADRVATALDGDPTYYFRHVDVQADDGKVFLGGYVWSDDAIRRAELIASRVPGVTAVADELALERDGGRPVR
jgi:osmotically-inducible protein OsmY